ncbi:MAG: DUF4342 domain-containing protein [Butyrivibrio sp.]|nr:DUF4342 domain-containing protein [Butyrivibrio sp.]
MENFEKVEKLREKTGVSYEDAKKVLEENNYDMLEAIIALERQGKVAEPKTGKYTAGASQDMENVKKFELAQSQYEDDCKKNNFKEGFKKIGDFIKTLFHKSLEINFCINKNGQSIANVPLLVLVLLLLGFFWITLPLIVIGLFFGITYSFTGVDKVVVDVNDVCNKASQTAENIKNEFKKDEEQN